MATSELIAPITSDLRAPDNRMDIIKGNEFLKLQDVVLDPALVGQGTVELGDWLVKGSGGTMVDVGASAVANTYPVYVGNDQFDAQATGQVTLLLGGGFIYRTTKYTAGSYTVGQNLTVKGVGNRLPQAAGGSDPVLCRVFTAPDSKGVMEIQVLDR